MIDFEATMLKFVRDSPISVRRQIERHPLHLIAHLHFDRRLPQRYPPSVKASPIQPRHLAKRVHGFPFAGGLLDFFKQAFSPFTTAGG